MPITPPALAGDLIYMGAAHICYDPANSKYIWCEGDVTVELKRKGALAGGIKGTLKLKGGAALPTSTFDVINSVEFSDADFSDGDTTTCTFGKGDNPAEFYQPVIE